MLIRFTLKLCQQVAQLAVQDCRLSMLCGFVLEFVVYLCTVYLKRVVLRMRRSIQPHTLSGMGNE